MYGYRNTNRGGYRSRYHSTKRHVASLTNTVMRLNPFKSKRHYANGKPDPATSLAVLVTIATVGFITFWVLIRALFFGGSSSTSATSNKYTTNVIDQDINPELKRVMEMDVEHRYDAFDKLVEKQCLSKLPFHLPESAADSALMQFQTWFWHHLWQTKVYAPRDVDDYVVTEHGTILASNDPELKKGMQNGKCDLINDMLTLLKANNLLEYVDNGNTEEHQDDSFATFHNLNNDDIWTDKYKHLFKMDNENHDAWKLIEQSLQMEDKDPSKRRGIEIMSYNLLHSYCYNIFDHLNMNANNNDYTSHETFLHEMTRHLFSLKFADYGFSQSEIPIVAPDGTLNIGHRGVELEGDYETCPFMQKLIFYHHSDDDNNLVPQIEDALNAIRQEEYHRQHLQTYDAKMDVLFEEHCGNMVSQMQNHHVYHTNFRDNFYEFSHDLVHNQIPQNRKFFVDVTNGDIIVSAGRRTMECKLVDQMIKQHGVKSASASPSNYEMSKFNAEKLANVRTEREFADFIATLVNDGDLSSLRHVVAEALTRFYSSDIKKKMSRHYKSTSAEYDTMLQTLSSSMEQFILDIMDNSRKITKVENNVVMDVESGIVVAVSDSRLKSLSSSWIKVDLVNLIRQSQSKGKTSTKKSTTTSSKKQQPTKSSTKSSSSTSSNDSELSQIVSTLLHDVSKMKNKDNIMKEFDEDIEHGLNTYCQSTMKSLSSFGKRQLRKNVGSLLAKRTKMNSPVVVDKGAISEFNDVKSNQQVFKCSFVVSINAQL